MPMSGMHGAQMPGQMSGQMPGQMQGMPGFQGSPYPPMSQHPYGGNYSQPVPPVEQMGHLEGRKKSSIARDVAIGVAIAALVLGGFLAVKFLLLDGDGGTADSQAPTPAYAKLQTNLSGGDAASLYLDDKLHANVRNNQEFEVQPGPRKVKLVGPAGAVCFEQELALVAGKVTPVHCVLAATAGSAATAGAGSAAPAAAGSTAPAGAAAGSAGNGSAAATGAAPGSAGSAAPTTAAPAVDRPVPDKTDRMPTEDKAGAASTARKPVDRAADKPADKATDKAADRAPDRPAADKDKARPADRAAKQPATDDDPLGKLQGGVKPGDAKAQAARKPR
jgi:hypothetical protein